MIKLDKFLVLAIGITLQPACGASATSPDFGSDLGSEAPDIGLRPPDGESDRDADILADQGHNDVDGSQSDAAASDDAGRDPHDGGAPSLIAYTSTYLGGIVAIEVDPETGAPTPLSISPFANGVGFYSLVVHGDLLYAAAQYPEKRIFGYRIGSDGGLTPVPGSPYSVVNGSPITIAVDPAGRFVYTNGSNPDGTSPGVVVYSIDADSGALLEIPNSPFPIGSPVFITFAPNGDYLYFTEFENGIHAFALDPISGEPRGEIDGSPFGAQTVSGGNLLFHPNGQYLYGGHLSAFGFDEKDGKLTEIAHVDAKIGSIDKEGFGLAMDAEGKLLFGINSDPFVVQNPNVLSVFSIDSQTGQPTAIDGSPFPVNISSLFSVAVDPAGKFAYVAGDDGPISILSPDAAGHWTARDPVGFGGLQPQMVMTPLTMH
jgi:6-phosphogluconolactonase (cycloisomerase 2 family)